ncbi:MAG TPA: hypothetical protein VGN18_05605 [Jatrophihabitans sp.]|jgi:photosystem II stability/assembly factor-like uncharacterized protein|uniref:WD40/YVTN/BNR-like repeat-containing protein n=1 Tax=Jatrophihabitans sp. TaxID=1932789 RepID=UPI002E0C45EF|nr:hypothetical protein [Jatrophihabitans sp.]
MRHHPENRDLELALRRSLYEQSGQAPAAGPLAERIVAAVDRPIAYVAPPRRQPAWRTWALPLLAAGAAAAVVGAVAVVQSQKPEAGVPAIDSPTTSAHASSSPPAAPTHASTPPTSTTPSGTGAAARGRGTLSNLRLLDVTFDGADDGWALASSTCLTGPGRCTALLRTTDGTTWTSVASTPFNVAGVNGCAAPCVQHLRFATSQIGYAYGSQALFVTTDGAKTWHGQTGGAEALETLDGNVIRVVSGGSGCPGPCHVGIERSAIGSSTWTAATLPTDVNVAGLAFARGGSAAYLLAERNPAGGANNATATLYASTDDGATWHAEGEPCPQVGGEVDSHDVAAASGTRLTVLCTVRDAGQRTFVATSTDGGRTATAAGGTIPVAADHLAGDPRTVLAAGGDRLAVSRDGGATWTTIPKVSGPITFVGFESATIGRVIGDNGQSLWTTRDGGLTWQRAAFR